VVIALVGIAVPVSQFVINFATDGRPLGISYFLVLGSIYSTSEILLAFGNFLILEGFAQGRPDSRPWTSLGGVVVLVGGAAAGLMNLAYFMRLDSSGPGDPLMLLFSLLAFALRIAVGAAFLAGLYGLGRAVLARPSTGIADVSP
jgi:hypothetical protein